MPLLLLLLMLLAPPGLLHADNPDWVSSFVAAAGQRFEAELAAGQVDAPRLLLRLFACLSRASVLHHADVVGLLQRLVEVAHSLAASGGGYRRYELCVQGCGRMNVCCSCLLCISQPCRNCIILITRSIKMQLLPV
jgi:hypothetical protein